MAAQQPRRSRRHWTDEERIKLLQTYTPDISWPAYHKLGLFSGRSELALYTEYRSLTVSSTKYMPNIKKQRIREMMSKGTNAGTVVAEKRPFVPEPVESRAEAPQNQPRYDDGEEDEASDDNGDIEPNGQTQPLHVQQAMYRRAQELRGLSPLHYKTPIKQYSPRESPRPTLTQVKQPPTLTHALASRPPTDQPSIIGIDSPFPQTPQSAADKTSVPIMSRQRSPRRSSPCLQPPAETPSAAPANTGAQTPSILQAETDQALSSERLNISPRTSSPQPSSRASTTRADPVVVSTHTGMNQHQDTQAVRLGSHNGMTHPPPSQLPVQSSTADAGNAVASTNTSVTNHSQSNQAISLESQNATSRPSQLLRDSPTIDAGPATTSIQGGLINHSPHPQNGVRLSQTHIGPSHQPSTVPVPLTPTNATSPAGIYFAHTSINQAHNSPIQATQNHSTQQPRPGMANYQSGPQMVMDPVSHPDAIRIAPSMHGAAIQAMHPPAPVHTFPHTMYSTGPGSTLAPAALAPLIQPSGPAPQIQPQAHVLPNPHPHVNFQPTAQPERSFMSPSLEQNLHGSPSPSITKAPTGAPKSTYRKSLSQYLSGAIHMDAETQDQISQLRATISVLQSQVNHLESSGREELDELNDEKSLERIHDLAETERDRQRIAQLEEMVKWLQSCFTNAVAQAGGMGAGNGNGNGFGSGNRFGFG